MKKKHSQLNKRVSSMTTQGRYAAGYALYSELLRHVRDLHHINEGAALIKDRLLDVAATAYGLNKKKLRNRADCEELVGNLDDEPYNN